MTIKEDQRIRQRGTLIERHAGNPILKPSMWPHSINSVFNPGAIRLKNGETLLLARVEDRRGISHLTAARSKNGVSGWQIDEKPTFFPDTKNYPEEMWGVEDPRIMWMEELNRYAITYTSYSQNGPGVSLALTEDFKTFERRGIIAVPEDKDAALFPRRFDGRWAIIHRPVPTTNSHAHMWISFSPDLKHWGDHQRLIEARDGAWWDARKIGLSPQPLETPEGWLIMYHGVRYTPAGCLYRQGLALLDLEDPTKLLYRGDEWIFGPEAPYERTGDVGDVVFVTGWTIQDDGDTLNIYYGAADTSIGLAHAKISELLNWLKGHSDE